MRTAKFVAYLGAVVAALLSVSGGAPAAPQAVGLSVSPANYNFGQVSEGTESSTSFQVLNTSASSVTITSATISPASYKSFSVQNLCGATIAANSGCFIDVDFAPVSTGLKNVSLVIVTSAGTLNVAISGTGLPSAMVLNPPSLAFGTAIVGEASTKSSTLTNTSGAAVGISGITLPGTQSFTQTNNCGNQLAASASCTINVQFDPVSAGIKNYAISIADTLGSQSLPLTGTGAASAITLTPSSLTFGSVNVGKSNSSSLTVQNISASPVTFSSIGITPAGTQSYSETNNCPATIPAGASCAVNVVFAPIGTGVKSSDVSIALASGTQTVQLTGTGLAPQAVFMPSAMPFGTQPVGYKTSKVSQFQNTSASALTISSISFTPATSQSYSVSDDCPAMLAAGAACNITVQFDPVSTGGKAFSVVVNGSAGTQTLPVQGIGGNEPPPTLPTYKVTNYSKGGGGLVTGDFNGDGKVDFAVAAVGGPTIYIYLSNGDGTFTQSTQSAGSIFNVYTLVAADFNNDGKQDLLVGGVISGVGASSEVLLGNGDGTFTAQTTTQLPPQLLGPAATGDFDGDGKVDLVAVVSGEGVIYCQGNGDGTFKAPVTIINTVIDGLGLTATGVVVGDFNGDKKLDVAATYPTSAGPAALAVAFGNGDGNFRPPITQPLDYATVSSLEVGDFNQDGKLDLVLNNHDGGGFVEIAYGEGNGRFRVGGGDYGSGVLVYTSQPISGGYAPVSRVADVDGDGLVDIVAADYDGTSSLGVLLNPGLGRTPVPPGTALTLSKSGGVSDLIVADFNGDGVADIVISYFTDQGHFWVYMSQKPQ